MVQSRGKILLKNVAPAILANACVFLFSVVDGIFMLLVCILAISIKRLSERKGIVYH